MAYLDNEPPEKKGTGRLVHILTVIGLVVLCGLGPLYGKFTGASPQSTALICVLTGLAAFIILWLVRWQTRRNHINDEYAVMRARRDFRYWGGASLLIIALLSLVLKRADFFLPASWLNFLTRIEPHLDAFAGGLQFACYTSIVCFLILKGFSALRQK